MKALLKLLVSVLALGWVLTEIDWQLLAEPFSKLSLSSMVGAFLALHLAQITSAFRMRYYLKSAGIAYGQAESVQLYYTGMFFNTFLPGGIGGDGVKVYRLHKQLSTPVGQLVRLQLSERASGLLALLILVLVLVPMTVPIIIPRACMIAALVIVLAAYRLGTKVLCRELATTSVAAFGYSLLIQLCTLWSAWFLMVGLGVLAGEMAAIALLFLAASVAAILPISIGGVGLRELVFLYGAPLFGVDAANGIALGLAFFGIYLMVAVSGYGVKIYLSNISKKSSISSGERG